MNYDGSLKVNNMPAEHTSVLAEFAAGIALKEDAVVVDATVGCGGHSTIFAKSLSKDAVLVGLDIDQNSLMAAQKNLADLPCKVVLV